MKKLLIVFVLFFIVTNTYAATYYYSQSVQGLGEGTACNNSKAVSSLSSDSLTGDDIVIFCDDGGTITSPTHLTSIASGSLGNQVVFQNEAGADVIVDTSGAYDEFWLDDVDYLTFQVNPSGGSFTVQDPGGSWFNIDNSNHIIIDGIIGTGSTYGGYTGIDIDLNSDDILVKNVNLSADCEPNDHMWIEGSHVVVKDSIFGDAAHQAITVTVNSEYIIIKNSVFNNNNHTNVGSVNDVDHALYENNVFYNNASVCGEYSCPNNTCGSAFDQSSDAWKHSITQFSGGIDSKFRFNLGYNDGSHGMFSNGQYKHAETGMRIYNNTIADGCRVLLLACADPGSVDDFEYVNNIFLNGNDTTCGSSTYGLLNVSGASCIQDLVYENNVFYGTGNMRYKGWANTNVDTLNSASSEWSGNLDDSPNLDSNYRLQETSTALIDAGRYHTKTVGTGSSSTSMTVADGNYIFSKEEWGFTSGMVTYEEIESDTIYVNASSPFTVQVTGKSGNTITIPASTWQNDNSIVVLNQGQAFNGDWIDIGAFEYDTGVPAATPAIYELDADGDDTNGTYDLSEVIVDTESADHQNSGVVIDGDSDAYYKGSSVDAMQITEIACINLAANSGTTDYPIVGRFDRNNGKNSLMAIDRYGETGAFKTILGYNAGASVENYAHDYEIPTSTDVWVAHTIDGTNKLLNQYVMNSSGTELGTDVEDQAIMAGRTWNYNESSLVLGVLEYDGSKSSGWYAHGTIKYYYRVEGILSRADIVNIVTASGSSSPTISSNCWSSDGSNCLSADYYMTYPGQVIYHILTGDEAFYSEGGPGVLAAQLTASATNSKTLSYSSGYGTTKLVLAYTAQALDRFGALQLASTNPVSEGTDNVVDSENNAFDMDGASGLDNALTYKPIFSVETFQHVTHTAASQPIGHSSSAQEME